MGTNFKTKLSFGLLMICLIIFSFQNCAEPLDPSLLKDNGSNNSSSTDDTLSSNGESLNFNSFYSPQVIGIGDHAVLNVSATGGTGNYTYTFRKNGQAIPSSNGSASVQVLSEQDSNAFSVEIFDGEVTLGPETILLLVKGPISEVPDAPSPVPNFGDIEMSIENDIGFDFGQTHYVKPGENLEVEVSARYTGNSREEFFFFWAEYSNDSRDLKLIDVDTGPLVSLRMPISGTKRYGVKALDHVDGHELSSISYFTVQVMGVCTDPNANDAERASNTEERRDGIGFSSGERCYVDVGEIVRVPKNHRCNDGFDGGGNYTEQVCPAGKHCLYGGNWATGVLYSNPPRCEFGGR